ncbi:MAG: DegV family protein [Anaerolineaceae bacterium]
MRQIRILTDNSVKFNQPICQGIDNHITIPLNISILNSNPHPIIRPGIQDFPKSLIPNYSIKIVPPNTDDFSIAFQSCSLEFNDFLVLASSSRLPSIYTNAVQSVEQLHGHTSIHVLDTLTIHAGLLYLVQEASRLIKNKEDLITVEAHIRKLIPHIYTLLCIPNLSYLSSLGVIDPGQAIVGEMMGLLPVFSMEDGLLSVLDKFHKTSQVIDYFISYLSEFIALKRVMIIHNRLLIIPEINQFFEFMKSKYPCTILSEIPLSVPLTAMLGPEVFGMIAIESTQ